jgi:type I restriction enzyme S subunit
MTELPPGWARTTVGEVSASVRGVTYKKEQARAQAAEEYVPLLRATNISGGLAFDDLIFVPSHVVRPEQYLRLGDVVVASSSGSSSVVGKSAQLRREWNGTFGAFCMVLRPSDSLEPSYLAHYVGSPTVRQRWSALAAGTNINNLKRDHITETTLPLPPLNEQKRIVAAIEAHLSHLDRLEDLVELLIGSFNRGGGRVGLLRRSILDRAFRGELVPQDPSDEPASLLLERIRAERAGAPAASRRRGVRG